MLSPVLGAFRSQIGSFNESPSSLLLYVFSYLFFTGPNFKAFPVSFQVSGGVPAAGS